MIYLKIALFISSLSGGGAERVASNLANYLSNNKFDVTILTMSDIEDTYTINHSIKRDYLLRNSERKNIIYNNIMRYKNLKRYLIMHKEIDCYIVMLPIPIFMLTSLRKYTNAKIIMAERNNPLSYKLYKRCLMKYAQNRCDGLVVQTKVIGDWYKVKNKIVIPNAINPEILSIDEKMKEDKKIVAVGRLDKQKNYPLLINAFKKVYLDYPGLKVEIYGKGKLENKLKAMTKKMCLDDKIIFKGYVNNISKQISNAKIFVMTSDFEGMPNALIEAMCLGLPCISTDFDGGGARELIENGINGIIIKKNDEYGLVNSIKQLLDDKKLTNKIKNNAKELRRKLSYDTIYNEWKKYIEEVIEGKHIK